MLNWLKNHLQVFFYTLGQLNQKRLGVAMTLLALGIGFSLPVIMYSAIDSISNIGGQWQERPQITLYLNKSITPTQAEALGTLLAEHPQVDELNYISAEQGLKELSTYQHFDEALTLLDQNPLPPVYVVYPKQAGDVSFIAQLSQSLGAMDHVESAQYDFEWLQKLGALTSLAKRAVLLLASIISIGIVILIANTIRLEISQRKDEIEIIDQLGGTPSFIARPFLYLGFLEGFLGGLTAILLSAGVLKLLNGPMQRIAELYGFAFNLPAIRPDIAIIVLASGGLLGWASAHFTVYSHMRALAPE